MYLAKMGKLDIDNLCLLRLLFQMLLQSPYFFLLLMPPSLSQSWIGQPFKHWVPSNKNWL